MKSECGRLLVVDDNEMNRDMLSRRLQRRGHEVVTAEDGERALAVLESERFDVVLLDVMMPGIDGFEVLRRLRATHPATELPIIMATAKDDREDIVQALELGANDYVTKPLDFPVVAARVQTQLTLKRAVDRIVALERDLQQRNEQLQTANDRMKRDLDAAARIQQALLPAGPPPVTGVRFAWTYHPCDELAGDILNVFLLDDEHVGLYLLDVSGHGVPAALLSVTLSRVLAPLANGPSLVRRQASGNGRLEPTPPQDVAAELNRQFQIEDETDQYFTLMYGVLNVRTRELRYASAGHPGPIRSPRDADAEILSTRAFAIGWVPDAQFEERSLRLEAGERIYFYSDGINEAMDGRREMFGEQRIVSAVNACRGVALDESLKLLVQAAKQWCGKPFHDDVSALAIEIEG